MFDGIGADVWINAGGWAVLALFLTLGWLVPKRTVDREQRLLIREAEGWKSAYQTQAEQLGLVLAQLRTPPPAGLPRLPVSSATDAHDVRPVT